MHGHTLVAGDESDDVITGHRHATTGEFDPHIAHALDGYPGGAAGSLALHGLERQNLLLDLFIDLVGTRVLDQMRNDVLRGDLTVPDGREHGVRVREVEIVGHTHQRFRGQQRVDRQVAFAHRPGQLVATLLDGLGAAFLGEPLANLVARLRTLDETQPVARRPGRIGFGRQNLDGVPIVERGVKRHQTSVDTCAHRAMTHFGVHGVREVDGRGMSGQGYDLAFRREHVDFGRAEILLE